MLYSDRRRLEDQITELALKAPTSIKQLHVELLKEEAGLSLRAVYKAVGHLIDAGVLLKVRKEVRVHEEWAQKVRAHLSEGALPSLAPGERVTYAFNSITHLDQFWKTVVLQLERLEKDGEVFFYNPHNFWAYVPERIESERAYYAHFAQMKRHAFFVVGGETEADREFKRRYQDDYLQIDARAIASLPRNVHLTVLGDYIITVRVGKSFATFADQLYESGVTSEQLIPVLLKRYHARMGIRFIFEHDAHKAKKLRKLLATGFYFRLPA